MKYMGSKARHAKEILPLILANRKEGQYYIEPFVGGANVIDKVDGNRIGADLNPFVISIYKKLQEGWTPPQELTEETYRELKDHKEDWPPYLVGYAGFQLSYGGKWFGGYRRDKEGKRNYAMEAYNNTIKQAPGLMGVEFHAGAYDELVIPDGSIIYCDPPYANTTKYKDKNFDHNKFWKWCEDMTNKGHQVFVSEYAAPDHWTCIWEKGTNSSLTKQTGSKKAIERLFVLK